MATAPPAMPEPSAHEPAAPVHEKPPGPLGAKPLGPLERAVVVMSAMGQPVASRLVEHLRGDERARMLRAADGLPDIGPDELEAVVAQFESAFVAGAGISDNRANLEAVFEQRLIEDASGSGGPDGSATWRDLSRDGPERCAAILAPENVRLSAVALGRMDAGEAAALLHHMSRERAGEVLRLMAMPPVLHPDVAAVVERHLAGTMAAGDPGAGDPAAMASVLNELERDMVDALLLEAALPGPAEKRVRDALFAFEDLARLSDEHRTAVLDDVDAADLAVALESADDSLAEAALGVISPRTRRMVEAQRGGAHVPDAVREARRAIARRALDLAGEGAIEIPPAS